MGAWSASIFSDDLALDIRREFMTLVGLKRSTEEAEKLLYRYYWHQMDEGGPDRMVYSFSLALTEWKCGRLTKTAQELALYFLDRGGDLVFWDTPGNEKNYKERAKVLERLKKILLSPQPPQKKVTKPRVHRSPYKVGDLLLYEFGRSGDYLDSPFLGKKFLFRVVAVNKRPRSELVPDEVFDEFTHIGLYNWNGEKIPEPSIVENLEYTCFREYTRELPPNISKDLSNLVETLGEKLAKKFIDSYMENFGHNIVKSFLLKWEEEKNSSFCLLDRNLYSVRTIPDYCVPTNDSCFTGSLSDLEKCLINRFSDFS